jgi:Lrp/AsnC family transcriptional regulator, leucine-responsive regulatory protein
MAVDMDALDHRILALLLRDGRTPASQIADQVGLSRPAVADRIEKLERQGVIRGTTVVVEPSALGRGVTAFIAARGATLEVHTVAGDDCYLLKVRTDSIGSLNALVAKLTTPPLSLATRTTIVMQTHCEKVGGIILGEGKP